MKFPFEILFAGRRPKFHSIYKQPLEFSLIKFATNDLCTLKETSLETGEKACLNNDKGICRQYLPVQVSFRLAYT